MKFEKLIDKVAIKLIELAVTDLPDDVTKALEEAYLKEESEIAKDQIKAILENIKFARENKMPICQDTGTIIFYIKIGENFPFKRIRNILIDSTRKATNEIPLRPNAINPFTNENSGDNTGFRIPYFHWEIIEDCDELELLVLPKGGGSENTCELKMLNPTDGTRGVKKAVLETIVKAGGKPCPPLIIGVGIGGGSDIAMMLAKKAILRPISKPSLDPFVAKLEDDLLSLINETGIGPMGLGGRTTALSVKIEYAYRHPASLPVGIVTQCWAARKASARISKNGEVEFLTHRVEFK